MTEELHNRKKAIAGLILMTLIVAGNFLVAKYAVARIEIKALILFRLLGSGIFLLTLLKLTGKWKSFTFKTHLKLLLIGVIGGSLNQSLFFLGLSYENIKPDHAALIYGSTGAASYLITLALKRESFSWHKILGISLSFAGAGIILFDGGMTLSGTSLEGWLVLFTGMIFFSCYLVFGQSIVKEVGAFAATAWAMTYGGLIILPIGMGDALAVNFSQLSFYETGSILYMIILTNGTAFFLWYYSLKYLAASESTLFTTLQPPMTSLFVWIFMGIAITPVIAAATLLVVSGIYINTRAIKNA